MTTTLLCELAPGIYTNPLNPFTVDIKGPLVKREPAGAKPTDQYYEVALKSVVDDATWTYPHYCNPDPVTGLTDAQLFARALVNRINDLRAKESKNRHLTSADVPLPESFYTDLEPPTEPEPEPVATLSNFVSPPPDETLTPVF